MMQPFILLLDYLTVPWATGTSEMNGEDQLVRQGYHQSGTLLAPQEASFIHHVSGHSSRNAGRWPRS